MVNHNFNSGLVHFQRFAERTGLAHEDPAAVAQGAVDGFDDARAAAAFGAAAVLPAGQHAHVGFPLVGEIPAVAAVTPGQSLPQPPGRGRVASARNPGHDAPAGPLDRQPQPDLVPFAAHKGPQLIEFERLPPLFFAPASAAIGAAVAKPTRLFFTRLATVMRATPVTRTILRCELRSSKSLSTCA